MEGYIMKRPNSKSLKLAFVAAALVLQVSSDVFAMEKNTALNDPACAANNVGGMQDEISFYRKLKVINPYIPLIKFEDFKKLVYLKAFYFAYTEKGIQILYDEEGEGNESLSIVPEDIQPFWSTKGKIPSISLEEYFARIQFYCNCSTTCYGVAFIYLIRLIKKHGPIYFNDLTFHRFLLLAVATAIKFFEDGAVQINGLYARIGGLPLAEFNKLEYYFLKLIDYDLNVSLEEFNTIIL
jgi:hypothetical protein